jgi:AcrR family transcriptional regulator
MLLSALVRFGERGFAAVPVREIASGAGVRASSMYEHRASKEELLLDLMLIGHEEHHAWLAGAAVAAGDGPGEQLRAVVRAHVGLHATYPLLARVCNRELGSLSPRSLERVLEVRHASEQLIQDTIERGVTARVFSVPDSYLAVAAIGAMGIRVAEWYSVDSGFTVDDVAAAYETFALRIVGYREADWPADRAG